ncbi:MAG: CsbD family protein [Chloroflexota bacterium]|nr:CsbD family protein [Chloroflexota bacterium]
MNSDVLQGMWKQLRGKAKEYFGQLTDDDLTQADGSADRMLGALQARYGYTKDEAQSEWDTFVNKFGHAADNTEADFKTK